MLPMTPEQVRYDELLPHEFRRRLAARPVAYLPLGTLEWHGEHLPLGADAIISEDLMAACARAHGGIVMPPIHVGPDRSRYDDAGTQLQGMDYSATTVPPRRLDGSCYWIPADLFRDLIDAILTQLQRAGFKAVFADGHGPSRYAWVSAIAARQPHFDLKLLGVTDEYGQRWRCQMDHAARNETSLVLAARPELVDLTRLPGERDACLQGISGADPRDACVQYGRQCRDASVALVAEMLAQAGV
jgi:creatinine amidohydrolase